MKLATFRISGRTSWGVVLGCEVADVGQALHARFASLSTALCETGLAAVEAALVSAARFACDEVEWLPVIPEPAKILCIGLNYQSHRRETGREETSFPAVFTRFADTQIGHGGALVRPRVSTAFDYEGELAIVIGTGGRHIGRDEAMAHVAGYACYNDATVRDWQRHTIQFTPGKNFPGTGAFGPCLVTADEIPDYRTLHLRTLLNGIELQSAGLDQLIFDIPTLIEYCSTFTPLARGDVIVTGTPGGVGFKREPQVFLKPGDTVEVEIPGVGVLRNHVADEA